MAPHKTVRMSMVKVASETTEILTPVPLTKKKLCSCGISHTHVIGLEVPYGLYFNCLCGSTLLGKRQQTKGNQNESI